MVGQEDSADFADIISVLPLERPPNVAGSALDLSKAVISERMPRIHPAHTAA